MNQGTRLSKRHLFVLVHTYGIGGECVLDSRQIADKLKLTHHYVLRLKREAIAIAKNYGHC